MYDVLLGLTEVKMTRPWRDDASFHKGRKVMAKEIQRSVKLLTIELERASSFGYNCGADTEGHVLRRSINK
jgi:hypothetical protein